MFHARCPSCQSTFKIEQAHLDAADGDVRCGKCMQVFHAPDHPCEDEPGTEPPPQVLDASLYNDGELPPLQQHQLHSLKETPVELEKEVPRIKSRQHLLWLGLALLLSLGLGAQYIGYEFNSLLQKSPRFRTLVSQSCHWLESWYECQVNTTQAPGSLWRSEELVVRSHPEFADALVATFIFRNTSGRESAFPLVELRFLDRYQQLQASRVFTPEEYLPAELRHFPMLAADTPVQAELVLMDPGPEADNYQLRFLPQ